jgi:hypothetical protein
LIHAVKVALPHSRSNSQTILRFSFALARKIADSPRFVNNAFTKFASFQECPELRCIGPGWRCVKVPLSYLQPPPMPAPVVVVKDVGGYVVDYQTQTAIYRLSRREVR